MRSFMLTLLLLCGAMALAFAQAAPWPPDAWRNVDLVWNSHSHDVVCHGQSAVPAGEARRDVVVGTDDSGHPVRRLLRAFTYRCAVNHEEIVVWEDIDSDHVRDVTCHQGKICTDGGHDGKHHGEAIVCPDGHTFYLIGAKHP